MKAWYTTYSPHLNGDILKPQECGAAATISCNTASGIALNYMSPNSISFGVQG